MSVGKDLSTEQIWKVVRAGELQFVENRSSARLVEVYVLKICSDIDREQYNIEGTWLSTL